MDFKGKRVAITGGAGEIGLVVGRRFAQHGAHVTLLDRNLSPEAGRAVETEGLQFQAVDVTDLSSIEEAIEKIGTIDIAIPNAGVHCGARFLELSADDWQLMLQVNATGVFYFSQAVARKMVSRAEGGNIVITGSWVQDVPHVDNTGYCSSKAAVAMLARCMALELAEHQIRVNLVAPGIVDAGMARRQLQIDPVFAITAKAGIPLARLQTAEEIADAILFLSSGMAASITGTTLLVDGGLSLFKR